MEQSTMNQNIENQIEEKLLHEEEVQQLIQSLPKASFMGSKLQLLKFQDVWYPTHLFPNVPTFQRHFCARDTDLIVASFPKTGTTWLKSLLFSIINRAQHPPNQSPLLNHNPHELVYDLETGVYGGNPILPRPHQLNELPSPRLLHTHLPYKFLPESIKSSACKILYISRNPFDTFVSTYHYFPNLIRRITGDFESPCIESYFEDFIEGKTMCGPFFDHVVEYLKQSLERPNKVLFLKYEDLKDDSIFHLKHLAEFIGVPFSPQEENEGVIEGIVELCSINNLKELEVNKSGLLNKFLENKHLFRKGEVGDWTHHFTLPMADTMNKLMDEKLKGTGLSFKLQALINQ